MTAFGILSIVAGLGLAAFLTCRRFSAGRAEKNAPLISRAAGYFAWLGRVLSGFFKRQGWLSVRSFYVAWLSRYPSAWQKWTLSGVVLSFLYLAASGFGFSLFSRRGLFGLPLLLHVGLGGIFSLSLAALVVLRAREYTFSLAAGGLEGPLAAFIKNMRPTLLKSIFFWLFSLSGLSLALTALLSMLSFFTYQAQLGLIAVHRVSGLVALLSAMLFLDQAIPRKKS